jgi:hypothetical protein
VFCQDPVFGFRFAMFSFCQCFGPLISQNIDLFFREFVTFYFDPPSVACGLAPFFF